MLVSLNRNMKPLLITMEHTKYLVKHKVGQQLNSTPQNSSFQLHSSKSTSMFHKLSLHYTVNEK